jgi:hypothetical protein
MAGMDNLPNPVFVRQCVGHSLSLGEPPGHKSEERRSHRLNGIPLDPFACTERRLPPIADDCVYVDTWKKARASGDDLSGRVDHALSKSV